MKPEDTEQGTIAKKEYLERKIALEASMPDKISKDEPAMGSVRKYALERIECLEGENRHMVENIIRNEAAINVYREMADLLEIEEEK